MFTLRNADDNGHFLQLFCVGRGRSPCPSERDILETRLIDAALLRSLPDGPPEAELFDPLSWAPRQAGLERLSRARSKPHVVALVRRVLAAELKPGR